jgi:hypothetical protein
VLGMLAHVLRNCGQQVGCAQARYHGCNQPVRSAGVKSEWRYTFSVHAEEQFGFRSASRHMVQCVRKVAVYLQKVLVVMSTSVYTGLNPINFIRKHFLQIGLQKVAVHL